VLCVVVKNDVICHSRIVSLAFAVLAPLLIDDGDGVPLDKRPHSRQCDFKSKALRSSQSSRDWLGQSNRIPIWETARCRETALDCSLKITGKNALSISTPLI